MIVTSFPRAVREIEHTTIPLKDGTRLAARIWLPEDAEADPVPALLEYLPYRKRDGTRERDALTHPYLAGHGYAAVRVDIRGSGESEGVLVDEYSQPELDDALEVIAWLAGQPWCSGAVGMFGISWGGFNALQVAALQPPALKAIVTLCSTDDRYADDVHYMGGAKLASADLGWGGFFFADMCNPPDPLLVGERWREMWLERLQGSPPFIEEWVTHQRRDAYWKHGSVCENYSAIEVPVYAVGGWVDGYTNAVPRLLQGLSVPRKGLIGPWAHAFPDDALPGPSIGFLQECVRWWDHWLKGVDTGIMEEPMFRAWMQDSAEPQTSYDVRDGRWVGEPEWPSPDIAVESHELAGPRSLLGVQTCGIEAGVWTAEGGSADLAGDQRVDDAVSLTWDFEPLREPLEILGHPEVRLELEVDRPQALVAVRLCDVSPDGASLLVTRGVLNLTHRESHEHPEPLEPGRRYEIALPLDVIAHSFPAGHHVRVGVSPTYWPWAWPSPEPVTLTVHAARLDLPIRAPRAEDDDLRPFEEPEHSARLAVQEVAGDAGGRYLRKEHATGRVEQIFDWALGGSLRFLDIDLESADTSHCVYSIVEGDPLSAEVRFHATSAMGRGDWQTRSDVTSSMTCNAETFHVESTLDVYENDEKIFTRSWTFDFPRDHV